MKKIVGFGLCITLLLASSCSQPTVVPDTEVTSSVEASAVQTSTSISATSTTTTEFTYEAYIPEYDIDQTFLNVTFEDVYNLCEEWTGVDLDELVQTVEDNTMICVDQDGYSILYIADYSKYLDTLYCVIPGSDSLLYYPEEYEFHILRRICINGFIIDELEDDYWAKVDCCKNYDYFVEEERILEESNLTYGYFYSCRDEFLKYFAYYISNNCVIDYYHSLNNPDNSDFITYLEICDRLGLPTSSEMTDEILN